MTKTQIKKDLMAFNEGRPFISLTELRKTLHLGKDSASRLVNGLYYVQNGKRKDYLVEDVAERLYDLRKC